MIQMTSMNFTASRGLAPAWQGGGTWLRTAAWLWSTPSFWQRGPPGPSSNRAPWALRMMLPRHLTETSQKRQIFSPTFIYINVHWWLFSVAPVWKAWGLTHYRLLIPFTNCFFFNTNTFISRIFRWWFTVIPLSSALAPWDMIIFVLADPTKEQKFKLISQFFSSCDDSRNCYFWGLCPDEMLITTSPRSLKHLQS